MAKLILRAVLARARAEEQPAGMPLHCRRRPRSVWRCADTTREPLWGTLARFLTIAWAANALLVVTFLELDLLRTLIGE